MTITDITLILLVLVMFASILFAGKAFRILTTLTRTGKHLDRMIPRLQEHKDFKNDTDRMSKSKGIVNDWTKDVRYFVLFHYILLAVSAYNVFYQDPMNLIVGYILIATHLYLISMHKSFIIKQATAVGIYSAMSSLILAATLYEVFMDEAEQRETENDD